MSTSGERYTKAVGRLAHDVRTLRWEDLAPEIRDRSLLVLFDTLGVIAAGAATPELVELRASWDLSDGPAPLVGTGRTSDEASSCYLNGAAGCCLELDEGSKYARGHPSAHVLPAAMALAAVRDCSGASLLEAFVGGYEVAARFGRATRMRPGVHMHGTWGATGAATAAGLILGLSTEQVAGAIDAASAQSLAPHFSSAFRGSFVRNLWMGHASYAGLASARLARAGLATVDAAAPDVFGEILGTFDVDEIDHDLGARAEITRGYFKRHAACAYTHPSADAVQQLLLDGPIDPGEVREVTVETYAIATTLDSCDWPTRLAAMFSIPYVVAETMRTGEFGPRATDAERRDDPVTAELARRVTLRSTDEFERRLPERRGARVTVATTAGTRSAEVENAIGDADYHPLGWDAVRAKIGGLAGAPAAAELEALVRRLPEASSVASSLADLVRLEVER